MAETARCWEMEKAVVVAVPVRRAAHQQHQIPVAMEVMAVLLPSPDRLLLMLVVAVEVLLAQEAMRVLVAVARGKVVRFLLGHKQRLERPILAEVVAAEDMMAALATRRGGMAVLVL